MFALRGHFFHKNSDYFFCVICLVLERSQTIFEGLLNGGTASKSWFAIFALLQRLRQACDDVSLLVSKSTSEIVRSKSGASRVEVDSACKDDGDDAVDNDFLSGLLAKFNITSSDFVASASESTYAMQVAETLSKCVQSSDEFLKSECPICLEEPMMEDVVYSEWISMQMLPCYLFGFFSKIPFQLLAPTCTAKNAYYLCFRSR